jgi:hypothetical protein
MPFDGAEFLRHRFEPPRPCRGWRARCAAVLRAILFLPPPTTMPEAMLRVLEEARGLIGQREDWVRGAYQTRSGERCAVGALHAASSLLNYPAAGAAAHRLVQEIVQQHGFLAIETMNDEAGHDEILKVFDTAIALSRRPGNDTLALLA